MAKRKKDEEIVEVKEEINESNEEIISAICKKVDGAEILSAEDTTLLGYVNTCNFALNYVCSGRFIDGGIPLGRITEIYGGSSTGKTVIGTHILQGVQKAGGIAVLIDSESAYSASFGEILGLDSKRLIYMQPETLEDCFKKIAEIVELIRSKTNDNRPIAIVYDSIAASPSRREFDRLKANEDLGAEMGSRALICSQYLRSINGILAKLKAAVIVINQTRSKIGVMFGCFNYDSRVVLENGKTIKIGKLVNQKIPVKVMCFNEETKKVEYKPIINWFKNGKANKFLQFKVEKIGGNGFSQFAATKNHMIFTPTGEKQAGQLKKGDYVLSSGKKYLSNLQESIAIGSVLGDGSIRKIGNYTYSLRIGHGKEQIEYCKWKQSFYKNMMGWSGKNSKEGWSFDTIPATDFYEMKKYSYNKDRKIITQELANKLDLLALAIWCMDDGTYTKTKEKWGWGKFEISAPLHSQEELEIIAKSIVKLGIMKPSIHEGRGLSWSGKSCESLQKNICRYIHPSMNYKLHSKFKEEFIDLDPIFIDPTISLFPVKIVDIYTKPKTRSMEKFDIEVADNHNYFVDNVLVHNSPETTAGGGNSLEFYCSVRLRCGGGQKILDSKKRVVGINVNVKNHKNKIFTPFKEASDLELFFDKGINPVSGLMQILSEEGKITSSGAWWTIVGTEDKFQRPSFVEALYKHPELIGAESTEQIRNFIGANEVSLQEGLNEDLTVVEGPAED